MKKIALLLSLLAVMSICVCSANADTPAREGMIKYTGTDAFTKLSAEEREACTSWLVYGGEMNDKCKSAVMKLTTEAPDAVTAEQRQALIAAASGSTYTENKNTAKTPEPVQEAPKQEIKKSKNYGGYAAVLGLGILAGLIIHNNTKHHHNAAPEPPRPAPNARYVPNNGGRMMPPQQNFRAPNPPMRRMPQRRW